MLIPVGNSICVGVLGKVSVESGLKEGISCKEIIFPLEAEAIINQQLLNLATALAARQAFTPGAVFGHVLPAGLRNPKATLVWNHEGKKKNLSGRSIASLNRSDYTALAADFLSGKAVYSYSGQNLSELEICSLAIDAPWPLRPAATKQIAILDFLQENGPASRAYILKRLGSTASAPLQKLISSNLVTLEFADKADEEDESLSPPAEKNFSLNEEQKAALEDLKKGLFAEGLQTRLLYGVTGSGKTAVYLETIGACLAGGRSAMLLAPEVALAHKLYNDCKQWHPDASCYLYHGYQHPAMRERLFRKIAAHKGPYIVIGTRSALFAPINDPGCIILDEEHDGSYKQDDNLPYHARELAFFRMQQAGGLLVLGSATPEIRSFHGAKTGKLPLVKLANRVSGNSLPPIELVALERGAGFSATPETQGLLAQASEAALTQCLEKGEQAVILLNRRGYAPLIHCLSCAQTIRCPHCQIGMAFHKGLRKLVCHYCGHNIPWPSPCPECGSSNYISIGEGTERITERLEALAGQPLLRLDRDSARRAGKIDEILHDFGAGVSPFLVGTQMLSKGHHFPNVTLVVVADGDIGLNLPDYRAAERTFQLLLQSAGRAGRGAKPGRAIIQTRNPAHYCWQHVVKYDYEGFYAEELERRKKYNYPPFTHLGLLRISWPAIDDEAADAARNLGRDLRQEARSYNLNLLGPVPAPIPMIKGRKRMHCLLKSSEWQPMRDLWFAAQRHKAARKLRISLDLDPVNML